MRYWFSRYRGVRQWHWAPGHFTTSISTNNCYSGLLGALL